MRSAARLRRSAPARPRCWRRSSPTHAPAAPAIRLPACGAWPESTWAARKRPGCSGAGLKITVFEPIPRNSNLALPHSFLYKRGLIGIQPAPPAAGRPYRTMPFESHLPRILDMAVPRRKTSPSRRGMRRSADAIKKPTYIEDKDSGELRRPHHLDLKTGMYKGRQVLKAKKES